MKQGKRIWWLIILFSLIYSFYAVLRHFKFHSLIFDLGVYDQIIWLVAHGKPFFSSILEAHPWSDHLTPTLVLLAPLYWIWDNVVILLIFQAVFICLGVLPIYYLALKQIKDKKLSFIVSFSYLSFYGIQNAIGYDFHPISLATTLFAFLIWFYEEKKYSFFWLTLFLLVGLQENFFLLAAAWGIYLIIEYRDFKRGGLIFFTNLILFLMTIYLIIPYFGKVSFTYLPIHLKNLTFWQVVSLLFYPYSKIKVFIASFLAFGWLPILSPTVLLILFEEFSQRFIGSAVATRWNVGYHYNAILAPILAFTAIKVVKKYFINRKKMAGMLILAGIILTQIYTHPALNNLLDKDFYNLNKTKEVLKILNFIPADSSVAATNNLGAHLSHREKITFLTNCYDDPTIWKIDMKRCFQIKPDYLVADLDPSGSANNFYPDSKEAIIKLINHVLSTKEYQLSIKIKDVYLLKRSGLLKSW